MQKMKDSIFTKLIKRELPAEFIYEDDDYAAFLSIMPHNPGHTIVIPKQQTKGSYFWNTDAQTIHGMMDLSQKIAKVLMSELKPQRVALLFEGFNISDHVHLHLIPINQPSDLNPSKAHKIDPKDWAEIGEQLRQAIMKAGI